MTYFEKYKEEVSNIYKIKYNKQILTEEDNKKIDNFLTNLKDLYKPIKISISNTTVQTIGEKEKEVDFISLYDNCRKSGYVFSLSHGVYKNEKSQFLNIWDEQIIRRKEFKEKMKDELKLQNYAKVSLYNNFQKVFKEIANAIYGASGEENFIFYDINSISNLTGTCYYTLLTTINQIEKILGNRVLLRSEQELLDYLSYIMDKDTSLDDKDNVYYKKALDKIKEEDKQYIFNKIKSYCIFDLSDDIINVLNNFISFIYNNVDKFIALKYNANFSKVVEDLDIFRYMIEEDFENFINMKFDEHQFKTKSKNAKNFLESFVYDDFLQSDLLDLCDNYKRSTVMLSDTDSTFCVATDIFNNIMRSLKDACISKKYDIASEQDFKVHSFKIIMFIGETMSDFFLKTLAGPEYQNSMDNRWKLKSEFLYHKILLLKVKKTYFGSILSQEGIRLSPMKLDNKNTELVRSKYSTFTKDFLKDIFDNIVMTEEPELDIYKLMDIVDEYNNKFDIMAEDYVELSKMGSRADFKLDTAYKNDPMTVWQYKAAATFNVLYPDLKNLPGDKTMTIPIKTKSEPKLNLICKLEEIFDKTVDINSIDEKMLKSIKRKMDDNETINAVDVVQILEKNEKLDLLDSTFIKKYKKEVSKQIEEWYINEYGVNEDLKQRFRDFFNKSNKSNQEKKVYQALLSDKSIGYLAYSYYSSMPESMKDIVDVDNIKLETVENRIIRIFDALRIKTYQKSIKSESKNFRTNFLTV